MTLTVISLLNPLSIYIPNGGLSSVKKSYLHE
jgi:hypothetical protein